MSTKIKICGLTREEDIEAVNEFLPDYIGFIFAQKSRRYVTPGKAASLAAQTAPQIRRAGVFVRAEISFIMEILGAGIIDVVQLHGQEEDSYVESLKQAAASISLQNSGRKIEIVQAFPVLSEEDVRRAESSRADYILLDQGPGGTGVCFDWKMAEHVSRPFFLAGGLNQDNVVEAIERTSPYAVDLSSGVETDGLKDKVKIETIIRRIRNGKGQIRYPRRTVYTGNADE
ncbi:phosphoribosylanthranilate isomerase [Clostridium sp. AM58-1XD]|uniref:phosphoribosylanthranilate isomerase n=1 Tax=Clostridium sp. AM58-1XD TaxID=2292307 RepID=UPI000E4D7375|nr:phosphoribosylanthranilate isomerase [Clostridium sp. AM58-1XD]RGZ00953.1 phosphoribosylanthranilate isomerase [Clostridium sp. AM58-1XD]